MSHGDKVTAQPPLQSDGCNAGTPIAAMATKTQSLRRTVPSEVPHAAGKAILPLPADHLRLRLRLEHADYVRRAIGKVRSEVGSDEVSLGLSGGVDSSVRGTAERRSATSSPASSSTTACCD